MALKYRIIPDEIRRIREKRGWTQEELAAKIGTIQREISRWESGERIPSLEGRIKLASLTKKVFRPKCNISQPNPAPTLEGSLWQSKENIAWTKEAIKNFRRIIGWTQDKLAKALQTSQDIISQWETGKFSPSLNHQNQLDKIATQLAKQEGKGQAPQVKRKSKKTMLMEELDLTEEEFVFYAETFAKNRLKYAQSPKEYADWFTPYRRLSKRQHLFKNFSLPIPCKNFIIYQVFKNTIIAKGEF